MLRITLKGFRFSVSTIGGIYLMSGIRLNRMILGEEISSDVQRQDNLSCTGIVQTDFQ